MKEITIYEAFDGMHFDSEAECRKHEEKMNPVEVIEKWFNANCQWNDYLVWGDNFLMHFDTIHDTVNMIIHLMQDFVENTNPQCRTTIGLFNYCIEDNSFGDICTVYYYDEFDDSFHNIFPSEI